MRIFLLSICFSLLVIKCAFADKTSSHQNKNSPIDTSSIDSSKQRDIVDVIHFLFVRHDTTAKRKASHKLEISIIPTVGYTLSTGFAIGASTVATFFAQANHSYNISVINAQAFYDAHNQQNLYIQNNIWFDNDNYKVVSDWRAVRYPDVTYGLGSLAKNSSADPITYNYVRLYQTVLRKIVTNYYVGMGYDLDAHWDIMETGPPTKVPSAYKRYGETSSSRSSGINIDFLYDSRRNPVNALGGTYFNFVLRNNYKIMGSDQDWSSAMFDIRKYFKFSKHSNNILAIWSYDWFTVAGRQPYLDLPSIGADMYNNTGRGYAINRFRGKNMVYLEAEYRFGITKNGILGGVVFGNAANYARTLNQDFSNIIPAGGGGVRIKINKHSNTNLCIDYGIGTQGSRGFFVNLGEVF